jgi:bacillithiol biosynthesis deacetylase BshB1
LPSEQSDPAGIHLAAFSPHPDDVEVFCGGTMLLAADAGFRTAVVDLTEGELSTNGDPVRRAAERAEANELLGLSERISLRLPDGGVGTTEEHRAAVVHVLRELRPAVVLAPYCQDRHPDHAAAGRLVQESCFFAGLARGADGPPHRPLRTYFYMLHHPFEPSLVVDISDVWSRRLRLLDVYESQFSLSGGAIPTAINDGSFRRMIEARAEWFGALAGVRYGEPLVVEGPLLLRSLPELDGQVAAASSLRYRAYG